ncbi:MAG: DUF2520 domain-containing protein [Gammaproteobacteria bacterium]|nr:DUF2520 domain-containing protein [Gammaproteobacteria bacterium]
MVLSCQRVNVIGAGRLGKVIAYLFSKYLDMEIVGICNQSLASSQLAAIEIGKGRPVANIANLELADIYLIAVPDDKIEQLALALKQSNPPKHAVVIHFSANLSTKALNVLDCHLASVHPMQSFSDFALSIANFKGTYCSIETPDDELYKVLAAMFSQLGAKPFPIQAQAKNLYHSAAVIAANYTVTLAHVAKTCLNEVGISNDDAIEMIIPLMQSVLNNLKAKKNCKLILTGPIARADTTTIEQHLKTLAQFPQIKALYQMLGNMSIDLVDGTQAKIQELKDVFEQSGPHD